MPVLIKSYIFYKPSPKVSPLRDRKRRDDITEGLHTGYLLKSGSIKWFRGYHNGVPFLLQSRLIFPVLFQRDELGQIQLLEP